MAYVNNTRAADFGLRARISAVIDGLGESLQRYRMYRNTVDELNQLTDRELADLGLHRSQITSIATEAAYGN